MENEPGTKTIENGYLYVYDAKIGKLHVYLNVNIDIMPAKAIVYNKTKTNSRDLPQKEFEIKCNGACFSLWSKEYAMSEVINILKSYIKDYAIVKTGAATKEYNNKCRYYRNMIKNIDCMTIDVN